MNMRFTRENWMLRNELVDSNPINAISNGGAREKVEDVCRINEIITLYYILTSLEIFQEIQRYKSPFVQTLENIENEETTAF